MVSKKYKRRTNEKVVSARLSKTDLSDYLFLKEKSNLKPIDIFRVGLRTLMQNKKYPVEAELMSKKIYLKSRISERAYDDLVDSFALEEIDARFGQAKEEYKYQQKSKLISVMELEHNVFMTDDNLDVEVRYDLSSFYRLKRNFIEYSAMKYGFTYMEAICFYDEYIEEQYCVNPTLQNGLKSH